MKEREQQGSARHLDLLRIDAVRTGEASSEEVRHVEGCRLCRGALVELREMTNAVRKNATPAGPVPFSVDDAIFAEFRRTAGRDRKTVAFPAWKRWLAPAFGTAAAAALVLVFSGTIMNESPLQRERSAPGEVALETNADDGAARLDGDINGDGRVDILDAFRLARLLEQDGSEPGTGDLNGDGRVSTADVDLIARRAVAL
jgi:hypothetical protein